VLAIFVFFLSFLDGALALFCLFCALVQLRHIFMQLQFYTFFVTGGCGGMNGFLGGNAFLIGGLGGGS